VRVTKTTSVAARLDLVRWADRFGPGSRWAVGDGRHLPGSGPGWDLRLRSLTSAKVTGGIELGALRAVKRRLSGIVYRAFLADGTPVSFSPAA
jgi:hypothetical protein